ncbi:GMC family oxidoreductase [Halioxenophilus sp. WMMB6]|uniref:GMC family oxidoreductase n=1 Tax=Halioxenophilus sp. WMMB6 TaxID=3073815 RepID=UPI00295F57BB|nr:GMC family oxidoreductase [Halioxenophilus sp. WMMB6]
MLIDLNQGLPEQLDITAYDAVIAGAGPVGISLAMRLAKYGKRVALLEGGAKEFSSESQDIYTPANPDERAGTLCFARLRYLGGTSNHWAGRCRPNDPYDFEQKSEFYTETGWPISYEEFMRYLPDAREMVELGRDQPFAPRPGTVAVAGEFFPDKFLHSPPTRFNSRYSEQLAASENIDLFINANLVDAQLNDGLAEVSHYVVKNYDQQSFNFEAKNFVVALGAIENARLLLNFDSQVEGGIGSAGGYLGRCFMEHINVNMATFIPNTSAWEDVDRMAYYTDFDFCRSNKIGSSNLALTYSGTSRVSGRARAFKRYLVDKACAWGKQDTLANFFDFTCPTEGVITTLTEQFPDKRNGLTLSEERDQLGLRRVEMAWDLYETDKRTIRTIAQKFAVQATEAGLGRFNLPDYILDENVDIRFGGHAHHLGTTRMAADPSNGVVNTDCQVFGTNNLYVAGCSVFPRGGANNPTMPAIQLALRLGDHLATV